MSKPASISRLLGGRNASPMQAGEKQPVPPPAGPATHPNERGPEEREPGTRKKGTPEDPRPPKPDKKASRKEAARKAPPPHAPHKID